MNVEIGLLLVAFVLLLVAAYTFRHALAPSTKPPRSPSESSSAPISLIADCTSMRRRLQSETTGIPTPVDDYATRRLARGSTPPPVGPEWVTTNLAPAQPPALRPSRPLTPVSFDDRWDLSERD